MVAVAEGYPTARSARELARKHRVVTPIIDEVYAMLYEGKDVRQAVQDLTARGVKGGRLRPFADGNQPRPLLGRELNGTGIPNDGSEIAAVVEDHFAADGFFAFAVNGGSAICGAWPAAATSGAIF